MNIIIGGFNFRDIDNDNDDDDTPHIVEEVMCVRCFHRWIGVFPKTMLLKELECPQCHNQGYTIATGQIMETEEEEDDD